MITTILAMACIVWLIGENRAYKALLNKQRVKEAELIDQMFDLQQEHEGCFSALWLNEAKMDTMMDYISELELKLLNK